MISDVHKQFTDLKIPTGDFLVCAGDITGVGEHDCFVKFNAWLESMPHKHKIFILGNHDTVKPQDIRDLIKDPSIHFLHDEAITLDGLKFYGSAWTPAFGEGWGWQLKDREDAKAHWEYIPDDTDVLITHGPCFGILDMTDRGQPVGDLELLFKVLTLPQLKLHVSGHIHKSHGYVRLEAHPQVMFVNASTCTESYKPKNPPLVIDL